MAEHGHGRLVSKWQADFERFLGGGLRQITAATIREHALATEHDLWVVSLELAAMNPAVYEAIHPDRAGWDAVVFDEAHRLTPTALTYYSVGRMLAASTPRAILMTATPHRGNEWVFRSLMHLTDPKVFPEVERIDLDQPANKLRPGALHFLRRMKEELVDYDARPRNSSGSFSRPPTCSRTTWRPRPSTRRAYFAMASGLREAARALSLLLNKPCEPPVPRAGRVRPPSAVTR